MIFLLELAKKIVQLEQLVHCLPVFKESSSVFFHFFSYIVTLKILNLWTLQTLSYSHNTWFGNKIKCTTKVRINYITAWSFLGSSRCNTWNYCLLLLNSLTVYSRVNSKLNKRLKYVGIYLNLWNWILSPYERVPKKHKCQDALCTLCKAHTFVQFLNTKMVGKTANITLHWRGSWENTPHDSDKWTAGFSFSIALCMLVNQRENLIFDHDLLQRTLFHFTWYAMSAA